MSSNTKKAKSAMKLLGLAKIEVNDAELDEQMEALKDIFIKKIFIQH